ncbi:MAG TPA: twin-arginine translocation signal domain-containing protein, partial [Terriglobales bacterium]|nr:twin-arginine translocation signal domain-containing protein [Terriglobales bacterium]
MKRRSFLKKVGAAGLVAGVAPLSIGCATSKTESSSAAGTPAKTPKPGSPETILLKDYRPKSIYKIPATEVKKAKFPIVDMHSHAYAKTPEEISRWVKTMDEAGVKKTIILSGATGQEFVDVYKQYAVHPERFELWCGFDYT